MECSPALPSYRDSDFLTPTPYEELYAIREDAFAFQARYEELCKLSGLGKRVFRKLYDEVKERHEKPAQLTVYQGSVTAFSGQPLELDTGEWRANDLGISTRTGQGEAVACLHPIMPVRRLVNVDTGLEKMEIAFSRGESWRKIIADKRQLAAANSIVGLSDFGIAVTSENAKHLVKYLSDLESYNYDLIPEEPSVGRLGHIEGRGFSPYVEGLVFDGDANFRTIFNSVHPHGDQNAWRSTIEDVRAGSTAAKIVIAAAFASVLVKPIGSLPFFVHLWGSESGTGKTVALMAAASVWADPQIGRYIQTFNSTNVGHERLAAFLNSLPVIVDELQLARNEKGKISFDVYKLAEGVGKTRGTRTGGIDMTPTWANCIITSGETPITGENSGAGARNRVLEIEATSDHPIVRNGHDVVQSLRRSYGHAGKQFVGLMDDPENVNVAKGMYRMAFEKLSASDTTEKQAMAAAIVLVADSMACAASILPGEALTLDEISEFLRTTSEVDVNQRAYDYLCDWITANAGNFQTNAGEVTFNTYGVILLDTAWIIRSIYMQTMNDAGYSGKALLSWMKKRGLIECRESTRALTKGRRINGIPTECVVLRLPDG